MGWQGAETWNAWNLNSGHIPPLPKMPLLVNSHALSPLCHNICALLIVIIFVHSLVCGCALTHFHPDTWSH